MKIATESNIKYLYEKNLLDRIESAVSQGFFHINIRKDDLNDEYIDFFKSKGYTVISTDSQKDIFFLGWNREELFNAFKSCNLKEY